MNGLSGTGESAERILFEDVGNLIGQHHQLWGQFDSSRVLLTGVTGFVGSFLVRFFSGLRQQGVADVALVLCGRNEEKARNRLGAFIDPERDSFLIGDVRDSLTEAAISGIDFCVHAASNANPVAYSRDPVGTLMTNVCGTYHVIDALRGQASTLRRMVYLSSVEAYGRHDNQLPLTEGSDGSMDPSNVRDCYPVGKIAAENLCAGAVAQYGLPVSVARLSYLYGPGDSIDDPKVTTAFLADLKAGRDIMMLSSGRQRRTYCYIEDAVFAILLLLLRGDNRTYNVSSMADIVTVADIARTAVDLFGNGVQKVRFEQPSERVGSRFSPIQDNILDNTRIRRLGFKASMDFRTGFERTGLYFGLARGYGGKETGGRTRGQ
ncbi:NAD-dependent epimerase/dehydratase [Bifidobacterium actinocoloniiforme DSM 22766]|uniref:NAD-dependent epimerase/dehydratase n=1 Tax=Bifidobacterium actinocoloniiforme DSM 22766 TaxID=1437605 RepID=A0A086Z1X6_9BIFI|nr:NAD(P)-dependent oxidoreductase [Bifidobacterium actinocoloniiforme]AKV55623.1 hypothetical protein AB656_04780 [Bifidobacterium actinocoloniiforme DSM 22766]KFI40526.1 NAD-dependent epimerase/dehydratase [Bifidobacterium actinocoloniiforme DSM 22766]